MKPDYMGKALLFPLLAVLTIVVYGGGLGVIFILLNETALGEEGVITLGLVLLIGVPGAAAILQRRLERS